MEPHGKNPEQLAVAIIPARLASTRLPGKMLREIAGRPLVLHTLDRVREAKSVGRVIVATDSEEIARLVRADGGEAVMTSPEHPSGSDRVAEAARAIPDAEIIINVQGDEPLLPAETINKAVSVMFEHPEAKIVTTFERIESVEAVLDPNVVKLAVEPDGRVIDFSRSVVRLAGSRFASDDETKAALMRDPDLAGDFKKHTGLYVYRREYLFRFTSLPPSKREKDERLEQLRALEDGAEIFAVKAAGRSIGVDTETDILKAEAMMLEQARARSKGN